MTRRVIVGLSIVAAMLTGCAAPPPTPAPETEAPPEQGLRVIDSADIELANYEIHDALIRISAGEWQTAFGDYVETDATPSRGPVIGFYQLANGDVLLEPMWVDSTGVTSGHWGVDFRENPGPGEIAFGFCGRPAIPDPEMDEPGCTIIYGGEPGGGWEGRGFRCEQTDECDGKCTVYFDRKKNRAWCVCE